MKWKAFPGCSCSGQTTHWAIQTLEVAQWSSCQAEGLSDIFVCTVQQMPFVWFTARAFAEIFPLVGLGHHTADYPVPIKRWSAPVVEQKNCIYSYRDALLFYHKRGASGMLANDGTDDHLGPHVLLAGSGRHHSLTHSPFFFFTPFCHHIL